MRIRCSSRNTEKRDKIKAINNARAGQCAAALYNDPRRAPLALLLRERLKSALGGGPSARIFTVAVRVAVVIASWLSFADAENKPAPVPRTCRSTAASSEKASAAADSRMYSGGCRKSLYLYCVAEVKVLLADWNFTRFDCWIYFSIISECAGFKCKRLERVSGKRMHCCLVAEKKFRYFKLYCAHYFSLLL